MKRLAPLLLALILPLSACAKREDGPPSLPEECRVVYRMESYEGPERTSHAVLTVVRNAQGVYYDAGGGSEYLFLEESPESYTMYIRSELDGGFSVSPGELVGREKVEQFASGVLHVGLLRQDAQGLALVGEGTAAGRPCFLYEGERQAGEEYDLQIRLLVDQETGLSLGQWLRYTHRLTGEETVYIMICELFETNRIVLPTFFAIEMKAPV